MHRNLSVMYEIDLRQRMTVEIVEGCLDDLVDDDDGLYSGVCVCVFIQTTTWDIEGWCFPRGP